MINKNYLYIIIFFIFILLVLWFFRQQIIDASNEGLLEGNYHENGGIKWIIRANRSRIEVEGKEVILDVNSMEIKDRYYCEGTPIQIASELNVLGGSGEKFADGGKCIKI